MTEAELLGVAVLEQFGSEKIVSRRRLALVLIELDPEHLTLEATEELLSLAGLDRAEEVRIPEFLRWLFGEPHADDPACLEKGSGVHALDSQDGPPRGASVGHPLAAGDDATHGASGSITLDPRCQQMETIQEDAGFEDMPDLVPVVPSQWPPPVGLGQPELLGHDGQALGAARSVAPVAPVAADSSGLDAAPASAAQPLDMTINPARGAPVLPAKCSSTGEACGDDLPRRCADDGKDPRAGTPSTAAELSGSEHEQFADGPDQPEAVHGLSPGTDSDARGHAAATDRGRRTPTDLDPPAVDGEAPTVQVEAEDAEEEAPRPEDGAPPPAAGPAAAPVGDGGSPRGADAERLQAVLAEFAAEERVGRRRVAALLAELDPEHFTEEACDGLLALAGLGGEAEDIAIQKFLRWVFGGPSLGEGPPTPPAGGAAAAPMTTEAREAVRAQFGGDDVIERGRMESVLKELDPAYFTDDAIKGLFSAAGVGEDSKVSIGEFLAYVFNGEPPGEETTSPALPTKVFFCRHGETDWNLAHKLQGLTDIPLNDAGREQAACIAEALQAEGLAAVWASPLLRARDTAAAVASAAGVALTIDERLRERNLGVMEGRTGEEVAAEYPEVWAAWKDLQELPPEGRAEPAAEVVSRVEAAMFDLAAAHPGKAVAVVAHGAVLRCLCKKTFGNASISTFSVGPGKTWKPVKLDDGSHLKTPGLKV